MLASKEPDIGSGHERRVGRGGTPVHTHISEPFVRYSAFLRWLCHGCLRPLIVSLVYRGIPLPAAVLGVVRAAVIRDPPASSPAEGFSFLDRRAARGTPRRQDLERFTRHLFRRGEDNWK